MKKIIAISMTLLAGISLAACSNDSSDGKVDSSTSSAKKTSQPQQSPVRQKNSSSASSSEKTTSLSDPKIIGVLAYQEVFGSAPSPSDELSFGTNTSNSNGNNGQYLVSSGSTVGTFSFSINGDQVTIYKMDHSGGASDAEASYTSSTVSLQELINKYYKTDSQKSNAQAVAQSFKGGNSSSDNSDQSNSGDDDNDSSSDQNDDDDDDSNSADQPSDDQNVDTNNDVDDD
ncbi:hypothetical protein H5S09_09445 [Limosilactobacillus sp. STM2_1]|uniref:Lreu-0056-like domain-containing protein n=1 Tax=Limosilactobacillus rudii TaxID=2759755 RepID=A0A7W3YNX4_9LACO|nr:hypothetical protein [Limosilactobacillus rudii]MBB1080027.1 hypothetical protein [Limosilactobacillus rudii]MBB1098160.1 hypothetical protein [Limosilactobacillus rudii]MCD7135232.1 hypothetical protein [Limosilactobacillus rudii]